MTDQLTVSVGKREKSGKRAVVVQYGHRQHRDVLDEDSAYHREKWRTATVEKFALDDSAHEFLESELYAKAAAVDDDTARSAPIVKRASEYSTETIRWLFDKRIPLGAVSGISGDPGCGKSTVTVSIGARVTTNTQMPDGSLSELDGPRGVLMLSSEDGAETTVVPRLKAAGADLDRACIFEAVEGIDGEDRAYTFPSDVQALEQAVREHDVALVVIDPFFSFMDVGLSMNVDADVRRAIRPLAGMAQRTGAAVLLVRHLNKKSGGSSLYRGGGSIAFTAACRSELLLARDSEDSGLVVLAPLKNNLAPMAKSLALSIEQHGDTSRVAWGGESDHTADSLLGGSSGGDESKQGQAATIIREMLADGERAESEVFEACKNLGISKRTYWRAREKLGVSTIKDGYQGGWLLRLEDDQGEQFEWTPQPYPEFEPTA